MPTTVRATATELDELGMGRLLGRFELQGIVRYTFAFALLVFGFSAFVVKLSFVFPFFSAFGFLVAFFFLGCLCLIFLVVDWHGKHFMVRRCRPARSNS
jgi:hypothetical protein